MTFYLTTNNGQQEFDNIEDASAAFTQALLSGEQPKLTDDSEEGSTTQD